MNPEFVDPRQRRVYNHAQLWQIGTLRPGAPLLVERANGKPVLAVTFCPVIKRLHIGLCFANLLPTSAAILR
jgi:hypothetical protein